MREDENWELARWEALRQRGAEPAAAGGWEPDGDEEFEEVEHGL